MPTTIYFTKTFITREQNPVTYSKFPRLLLTINKLTIQMPIEAVIISHIKLNAWCCQVIGNGQEDSELKSLQPKTFPKRLWKSGIRVVQINQIIWTFKWNLPIFKSWQLIKKFTHSTKFGLGFQLETFALNSTSRIMLGRQKSY